MRSVPRRSGVARPSLSLRWPNRDALILGTSREEIDAITARVGQLLAPDMRPIQLRLIADAPNVPSCTPPSRTP